MGVVVVVGDGLVLVGMKISSEIGSCSEGDDVIASITLVKNELPLFKWCGSVLVGLGWSP